MSDLFDKAGLDAAGRPLADRLRATRLSDVVGQGHIVGPDGTLTRMLASGRLGSVILWGPPGSGKTTVARLLADETDMAFEQLSAIFSGVKELRQTFERAQALRPSGKSTLLFVDEIHRFNKAQQDSFLPHMENGTITLVGATTENPSFELNAAVLSRAKVLTFKPLDEAALDQLLKRAEQEEGRALSVTAEARTAMIAMADGDGRSLLNMTEDVFAATTTDDTPLDAKALASLVQRRAAVYDKSGDGHYNLISALHKAVRGSDPDAALYWLARMLTAGEDPMYLARRFVRMAVEDIGLADPQALVQANAAKDAFHLLGAPEGELAIAQACIYLATAPKSNAGYNAYKSAMRRARETGSLSPPKHILNAPTALMRDEGYGADYDYDHNHADGFSGQSYFPDAMERETYYTPPERGYEREIVKRLRYWAARRDEKRSDR